MKSSPGKKQIINQDKLRKVQALKKKKRKSK